MKRAKPVWGPSLPPAPRPGVPHRTQRSPGAAERRPPAKPGTGQEAAQDPPSGHRCHAWPVLSPEVVGTLPRSPSPSSDPVVGPMAGQPYSEAARGGRLPPPPRTSPSTFAAPPRGRERRWQRGCSSKSGDQPAPRCHLGLQRLARARLPVVPACPRHRGSATARETKPSGLSLPALPQAECHHLAPNRPQAGMALVAPVPSSTSGSSGFG